MRLYFTRHGESQANVFRIISNRDLPHPLTERGRLQGAALAEKLRGNLITCIYASPILRARQTGEILSTALGAPLECVQALREPDCGILEGRGDPEAWAEHGYWLETWLAGRMRDKGPQDGETYNTVRERFTSFIEKLIGDYGESSTEFVLVAHGELMLLGLPGLLAGLETQAFLPRGLGYTELLMADCVSGNLIKRVEKKQIDIR
jgi:broad specificity phosphatase PhoE